MIVFRCDATPAVGLGHLSRCLGLAEAARRNGSAVHFHGQWNEAGRRMLLQAGFPNTPADEAAGTEADAESLLRTIPGTATMVFGDSYGMQPPWIARLSGAGLKVALFDDFAQLGDYSSCAGVINFRVGAEGFHYTGLSADRLALGSRYFPPREALRKLRRTGRRPTGPATPLRVLIVMGGEDRWGRTLPLHRAVKEGPGEVAVRALLPDGAARARAAGIDPDDFPPQTPDLAMHYGWADCCISGGGLTKYECRYLGVPVAIFSQTPEQQEDTAIFCRAGHGTDLAAGGTADGWELRLRRFLHRVRTSRDQADTPAGLQDDGADLAAARLRAWQGGAGKSASIAVRVNPVVQPC